MMLVLLAGVAVLAGGTGFAQWQAGRFPARSEAIRGTPVELRVQDGVTAREVGAVRRGIVLVQRFMQRTLGQVVRGPVEARVARPDRCRRTDSSDREVIGQGSAGFICVDTANVEWQVLINSDPLAAVAVSAHEYVHVLQAELGCLPSRDERYEWLVEGMATYVAWRALEEAGLVTATQVRRAIRLDGAFDSGSGPLRDYERKGGRTPQYALWHAAIHSLLHDTGRTDTALRAFCERVGAGSPWRSAFARTFGTTVDEFYAEFEAARPRP
jgi:hypothetical protein